MGWGRACGTSGTAERNARYTSCRTYAFIAYIHMDVVATNLAVQRRGVLEDGRVRVALRYLRVCVCVIAYADER